MSRCSSRVTGYQSVNVNRSVRSGRSRKGPSKFAVKITNSYALKIRVARCHRFLHCRHDRSCCVRKDGGNGQRHDPPSSALRGPRHQSRHLASPWSTAALRNRIRLAESGEQAAIEYVAPFVRDAPILISALAAAARHRCSQRSARTIAASTILPKWLHWPVAGFRRSVS